MAAIVLSLAEQRDLVRTALLEATCREMRFTGDGETASYLVAARAARRVRDTMPCASGYFPALVALELRDLMTTRLIRPWEWTTR
jgi:hypothetical protein